MSLRVQLLAIALLTLVLPWAGWRYVTEMESVLRAGLEQSLLTAAVTMAGAFGIREPFRTRTAGDRVRDEAIYAHPLSAAPRVDGYHDDWNLGPDHARSLGDRARYWAGVYERHLYLYLDVDDDTIVYQRAPTQMPYGDRVLLNLGGDPQRWLVLNTSAPGTVPARHTTPPEFVPGSSYDERVLAAWVETGRGYAVEARVPLDLLGASPTLGVGVIDVSPVDSWFEARHLADSRPRALVIRPRALAAAAAQFAQPGRRLRIVDADGWVLYDGGAIEPAASAFVSAQGTVREQRGFFDNLLRLILSREDPPYGGFEQPPGYLADAALRTALAGEPLTRWYRRGADASAVVVAAVPISGAGDNDVGGALLLELGSDSILTLTNEALVRLLGFTLLATVIAAGGLLGYATLLSFRIRRLARAAQDALGPQGDIHASLPGQRAPDEIGALARSVSDLLRRLSEYTDYLRSLKGKLAHELRTPLAVVATSLDNVERERPGSNLMPYLKRIREGSDRLDALINAMSEATAIEQAVADSVRQRFDLRQVVEGCVAAYRDVHSGHEFVLDVTATGSELDGSPELIAQMLDKLIDNAVSFSPPGGTIRLALETVGNEIRLSVANSGPKLPDTMRAQLFDSLVSLRPPGERGPRHLGLGLYIVSLIARFHEGRAEADNLPDGSGVVFRVAFPLR